jgi:hypothetical protein
VRSIASPSWHAQVKTGNRCTPLMWRRPASGTISMGSLLYLWYPLSVYDLSIQGKILLEYMS